MHYAEFLTGAYWAVKIAGHWLFRGPLADGLTDQIIEQQLVYSGPYSGLVA